ncbi:hypothetical protein ATANTOWER_008807 [Ataeniobius toweri]|uniref:Uncharacterized protein n=1 Tax=Ataeniobius toweri TaxID=208326 RepID=A0ABU7APL0_9TELE|nr:hypothetical protein [Ataeniobius toweri]
MGSKINFHLPAIFAPFSHLPPSAFPLVFPFLPLSYRSFHSDIIPSLCGNVPKLAQSNTDYCRYRLINYKSYLIGQLAHRGQTGGRRGWVSEGVCCQAMCGCG